MFSEISTCLCVGNFRNEKLFVSLQNHLQIEESYGRDIEFFLEIFTNVSWLVNSLYKSENFLTHGMSKKLFTREAWERVTLLLHLSLIVTSGFLSLLTPPRGNSYIFLKDRKRNLFFSVFPNFVEKRVFERRESVDDLLLLLSVLHVL